MIHEIKIRTGVKAYHPNEVVCHFWFYNPITKKDSLVAEYIRDGESNMNFVKRIKKYIKSVAFSNEVKRVIIKDAKELEKENKTKMNLKEVKKELDGLNFKIEVDLD